MAEVTSGIYLYDLAKDLILIGHVTNNGKSYSIPKGLFEEIDEDYFTTAIRELKEETNISYDDLNVILKKEFELVQYKNSNKKLKSYLVVFNPGETILNAECFSNFVDENGEEQPEIDFFLWVTLDDSYNYLSETQSTHIPKIKKIINALKTEI